MSCMDVGIAVLSRQRGVFLGWYDRCSKWVDWSFSLAIMNGFNGSGSSTG